MNRDLMDILACPICRGDLELCPGREEGDEVVSGSLVCDKCPHEFPIVDSIPNFLTGEMAQ